MSEIKQRLISVALRRYKEIFPCAMKKDLSECFTVEERTMMFWFNTADDSTHVVAAPLSLR